MPDNPVIRIKSQTSANSRRHLLLDLPIAWRLSLGFLLAALIAAAAAGLTGLQRAQSSSNEAHFYQNLLEANTELTTANSFLQLMNTEVHTTLDDAAAPNPSAETLTSDQAATQGLATRYDNALSNYSRTDLLQQHSDEVALLDEAGHGNQVSQQNTLVASVLRTWEVYRDAQSQVLQDIASGHLADAQTLERAQGEPTNADAQSALRALIQFNNRIAASVRDATQIEQQNQLITSLIAAVIAFICIVAVGWVISETLVRRLNRLRRVTQAVEEGDVGQRVSVAGRDEVADVSASVNGMLDTIVGLLDVTRRQHDALTTAAERLFSDVRIAGAGDLRVNAAVGGDPIGMLANAFNFTIGRFRRFVLRTQTSVEQLDVVTRQQSDRANAFLMATQMYLRGGVTVGMTPERAPRSQPAAVPSTPGTPSTPDLEMRARVERSRELVRRIAREGANYHSRAVLDFAEQAYISAGRLSQLVMSAHTALEQRSVNTMHQALRLQMEELRTLGTLLTQVGAEAHAIQKNTTTGLADLDASLEHLSAVAAEASVIRSSGLPSAPTMTNEQVIELVRLSSAFARDVAKMARQINIIAQEVRAGVTPFRLAKGDEESTLYAPGTGYGGMPASYGPFATQQSAISADEYATIQQQGGRYS
jgi:HAMP domain-containing protein